MFVLVPAAGDTLPLALRPSLVHMRGHGDMPA